MPKDPTRWNGAIKSRWFTRPPYFLVMFRVGRTRVEASSIWIPVHIYHRPWGRVAWHIGLGFISIVILERDDAR